MLYQKMEENSNLQRKLEQAQLQQVMFLSQMMQQNPALANNGLPSMAQHNLGAFSAGMGSQSQGQQTAQALIQQLLNPKEA